MEKIKLRNEQLIQEEFEREIASKIEDKKRASQMNKYIKNHDIRMYHKKIKLKK